MSPFLYPRIISGITSAPRIVLSPERSSPSSARGRKAERITAGQMQSSRTVRFTVRDSATARAIGPTHRLEHEGQTYHVAHAKEALDQGRRRYIEITAGLIDT